MLRIGGMTMNHPFTQAALSGYSDQPMRRVARRHGAEYTLAEVALARSITHRSVWQERLLDLPPDDHPVGAQLMGGDLEYVGPAATLLAEAGYDVIDINFGCPVRKVVAQHRGGYLLSAPAAALDVVCRVVDAVGDRRPVTVKLRRGYDESAESERDFFTILDGAFALGVAAVAVHARTVAQQYRGASDWTFLARVKAHVGAQTVLGSGDLLTARSCLGMMRETGVDGVTLARGAIGNPWIFRECLALAAGQPLPDPPTHAEQRRVIQEQFEEVVAYYGRRVAGPILRKIGIKYSRWHASTRQVRAAFVAIKGPADFQRVLDRWYDPQAGSGTTIP